MIKLGLPYIRGYKPRDRFQNLLVERVINYLESNKPAWELKFQTFADETIIKPPTDLEFTKLVDTPPERKFIHAPKTIHSKRPFKINYLELEQQNVHLGISGEQLVLAYEKWQLQNQGKMALADQVEWIAENDDGAGFDILSKQSNGKDKYIEVKTTKLNKNAPFFFSKGEDEFSKRHSSSYNLYRVFGYTTVPKLFMLQGAFDDFCLKEAVQFKGSF